ncbi:hypothetical protein G9A89_019067 [Geosiphon pyriformis]|nr:hypothetical protein G9A89_019067 [Geosiphon pyriformis]
MTELLYLACCFIAALSALKIGGASETGSALETVTVEKKLTDLQARIMAQWNSLGTSLLIGHCLSKSTGNRIRIYLSLEREM